MYKFKMKGNFTIFYYFFLAYNFIGIGCKPLNLSFSDNASEVMNATGEGWCNPVEDNFIVTQAPPGFNQKSIGGVLTHVGHMKFAVDFMHPSGMGVTFGKPVYAMADGKVISMRFNQKDYANPEKMLSTLPFGADDKMNYILLLHAGKGGKRSMYMHLQQDSIPDKVRSTLSVKKGDIIGRIGFNGMTTGTHLHVEVDAPGGDATKFTPSILFNTMPRSRCN